MGVSKLRLTGGEPLVRRDVMWLIEQLGAPPATGALEELTLTTNGSQLDTLSPRTWCARRQADQRLARHAGPRQFQAITRWGDFDKVMAGIEAAKQAGLRSSSMRWR